MASTYLNKEYPSKALVKAGHAQLPPPPENPKTFVYNIRGTNGSGKSFATRLIMSKLGKPSIIKTPEGVTVMEYDKLFVVGSYSNECGGLDTIRDTKIIPDIVLRLAQTKDVLIEGMMWSTIFGATHELNKNLRLNGSELIQYGFDGKVGDFIERVLKRRASKGNFKPYPIENMIKKVAPISHGLNHSILWGGKVVLTNALHISEHVLRTIYDRTPPRFPALQTTPYFYDDFEKWESLVDENKEYSMTPKQEDIDKYNSQKIANSNSMFNMFS